LPQDSKLEIITLLNKHWRYLQAYNNIESSKPFTSVYS